MFSFSLVLRVRSDSSLSASESFWDFAENSLFMPLVRFSCSDFFSSRSFKPSRTSFFSLSRFFPLSSIAASCASADCSCSFVSRSIFSEELTVIFSSDCLM